MSGSFKPVSNGKNYGEDFTNKKEQITNALLGLESFFPKEDFYISENGQFIYGKEISKLTISLEKEGLTMRVIDIENAGVKYLAKIIKKFLKDVIVVYYQAPEKFLN
jgi:hypothetical protein